MEKRNPLKIYETENQQIVSLSDGKIPPQAIDLEEAVIGAMLIDEKGVNEIIEILSPEVFYKKSHQLIYESIERLFRESEPIDLLTVSADLKKNKNFEAVGGDFYLINLSQKVSSSAHIEYHSRIIQQKYIQRKLISISNEIIQKSYNESTDVLDLLDEAESKLYDIAQNNIKGSSETAQNLVIQAKNRIEEIGNRLPTKHDLTTHLSTIFTENRLKKYIELRSMDTCGWNCLCAGPAFNIGMLYGNLDEAYELVSSWETDKIINAYLDAPQKGFNPQLMGKDLLYWTSALLNISRKGLEKRDIISKKGNNETIFLNHLQNVVDNKTTNADHMISKFSKNENLEELYDK